MAADIAELGLSVRSDGVVVATDRLDEMENQAKKTEGATARLIKRTERLEKSMGELGKTMRNRVTLPILAAAAAATKFASDFESSFANVRKTVDATEKQFSQMSAEIRQLAKEVPTPVEELNRLAGVAGQLGVERQNIVSFTRTIAMLGDTTDIAGEQAALSLSRFMNVMGTAQSDIDRVGSTIVGLGNNFAAMESEIVETATSMAAFGNQMGLTEAQVLAYATAIAASGGQTEAASTAFQKTASTMQRAAIEMNEDLQVFARVANVSAQQFADAFQQDASGAILMFLEGLKNISDQGQSTAAVLDELGLADQRLQREFGKLLGNLDQLEGALGQASDEWERNTALTKEAQKRYDTFESQLGIFWNRIKDVGITIGNDLIPAIKSAIESTDGFLKTIQEMDPATRRAIIVVSALAAALGPLMVVLSALINAFRTIVSLGPAAATAIKAVFSVMGGVVTVASAAAITAIIEINQRFGEIESIAPSTANAIDAAFTAIETGAENAKQKVGAALDEISRDLMEARALVDAIEAQRPDNSFLRQLTDPYNLMAEAAERAEGRVRALEEAQRNIKAAFSVSGGNDIFSRMEDGAAKLARALGLLEDESDDAADATDTFTASMEGLHKITVDLAEKTADDFLQAVEDLNEAYVDLVAKANPAIRTLKDMADAQEEMNRLQKEGFTFGEQQRQAILAQAAGLNAWATQQDIVNKLLLDAGVPEETLNTWREFVNLMSIAAGLGPRMAGIDPPDDGGGGGGNEDPLSDQLAVQAAQIVSSNILNGDGSNTFSALGGGLGSTFANSDMFSDMFGQGMFSDMLGGIVPILGSFLGGLLDDVFSGSADDGPPEFGISTGAGSAPGDPRTTSPVFGTDIVGHHFDDITAAAFQQILDSLAQFDREIAQIFDPSDFDAITTAFANFDETFEEGAATLEEAMERRFVAALEAAEPAIAGFVQSFGDLESMKEALQGIFDIRDAIDDFGNIILSLGDPVEQLTARLNRMQTGIEDAQTSFDQAMLAQDPAAIARTGQELQRAIVEKFELEKQLIEDLQSQLRNLELESRDFAASIAERIADVGSVRDVGAFARETRINRQAARQDVLNADDTQQALANLDRFVSRVDEWLDAARRRVTELRDMELERINSQIQALETEAQEILASGRQRAQAQQRMSQAVSQAAQNMREAELDAINEQLEVARQWQSVLDSTRQMIDNLTFSQTNPASRFSRLDMLNQRIGSQGTGTPEGAREMQDLLQRRLGLAQELFQRGSPEFESLFNDTMKRLSEIEDKAKSEAEIANDLQQKANALQSQTTGAVTSGTQRQIILSSEEQRRLEEIRDQQEALEAEAQTVRENAEDALQRIDDQARTYYQWAQGQRATLEAQRHVEITNELNAITGGLDPDSYIAQRQAEVVDRLTTIRDLMQGFLDGIQGTASGGSTSPGGPGEPPGGGGPFRPTLPEAGTTNHITVNLNGSGDLRKDARKAASYLKRELKTA